MSNDSIQVGNERIAAAVRAVEADHTRLDRPVGVGWWDGDRESRPIAENGRNHTGTEVIEPSGPLTITSIDARAFPEVSVFCRVDTAAGNARKLGADAFELREGRQVRDSRVQFADGSMLDFVLVLEDTGSMLEEVVGLRSGLGGVVDRLAAAGIDARYALVTAREDVEIVQDFTTERAALSQAVEGLRGSLGADRERRPHDPIDVATRRSDDDGGNRLSPFRTGARRVVVAVTDATATVVDPGEQAAWSGSPIARALRGFEYVEISDACDALTDGEAAGDQVPFATASGGTWFERPGRSADAFASLLTDDVATRLERTYGVTFTSAEQTTTDRSVALEIQDPEAGSLLSRRQYHVP